jgi:hypothetical protein
MSKVKIVSIRRNNTSTTHPKLATHRRFYNPKTAIVRREGSRAVDNMSFSLDINSKIQKGDEVFYIQDIVDVDDLKGIWNFYGNFRDESGYEQDDYYTGNYAIPECYKNGDLDDLYEPNGRFRGYYTTKCSTDSEDGLKMIKQYENQDNTKIPVFDMSNDFDIYFWLKWSDSSGLSTIIDFLNDNSSVNKGLMLEQDNDNDRIKLTVNDGTSGTPNVITTPNSSTANFTDILIRVTRIDGTFKIFLNNAEQTLTGTAAYDGDLNDYNNGSNTHDYFYLFKRYNRSTSSFVANTGATTFIPQQLRFYNSSLPDDESKKIFISKPQKMTMKFGGNVWKVNEGMSKEYKAVAFASKLFNIVINPALLSSDPSDSAVSRTGVAYTDGKSSEILADILEFVDGDEYIKFTEDPSSDPVQYAQGSLNASGLFIDLLEFLILMKSEDLYFTVLPRKTLIIEAYLDSNYTISNNNFELIKHSYDDTQTANYIECIANTSQETTDYSYNTGNISANSWGSWRIFASNRGDAVVDFIVSITDDSGNDVPFTSSDFPSGSAYQISEDKTQFRVYNGTSSTINWSPAKVLFVSSFFVGVSHNSKQIKSDSTSIAENGLHAKTMIVPQVSDGINVATFGTRYLARHKDVNQRVEVLSNSLVNSLHIGQKVGVFYNTKKIYSSIDTDGISTPLQLKVQSVEWRYPESITKIELGENEFDSFDVAKSEGDSSRSVNAIVNVPQGL